MHAYCTCTNLECPLHPTKHDKGCTPCIRKNLRQGEVPNCMFRLAGLTPDAQTDCSPAGFARAVLEKDGTLQP